MTLQEKTGVFSCKRNLGINMKRIEKQSVSRIYGKGRGWCLTPKDFLDIGSRSAVDSALSRLENKGTIRRLSRCLYDYPRKHPEIGLLAPNVNTVAQALSNRDAARLQPSGAYAANLLGLSLQVPAKIIFLTDGKDSERPIVLTKDRKTVGVALNAVICSCRIISGIASRPSSLTL